MYARTNRFYNERDSRTNYVRSSIPHSSVISRTTPRKTDSGQYVRRRYKFCGKRKNASRLLVYVYQKIIEECNSRICLEQTYKTSRSVRAALHVKLTELDLNCLTSNQRIFQIFGIYYLFINVRSNNPRWNYLISVKIVYPSIEIFCSFCFISWVKATVHMNMHYQL
jgi:hypothetical protein